MKRHRMREKYYTRERVEVASKAQRKEVLEKRSWLFLTTSRGTSADRGKNGRLEGEAEVEEKRERERERKVKRVKERERRREI